MRSYWETELIQHISVNENTYFVDAVEAVELANNLMAKEG